MLQPRARPNSWHSVRFASQLSQSQPSSAGTTATTTSGRKLTTILSRLSDRTRSTTRRISDAEQTSLNARTQATPRATSFISARTAQKRDQAAEKWFTGVQKLDIDDVDHLENLKPLPREKRIRLEFSKQQEMRPTTDLKALFAHSTVSSRVQAKKESGGDYASYLPGGYADPYHLPLDYARLVLGRNKHIPLNAQTSVLKIVKEAVGPRQGRALA